MVIKTVLAAIERAAEIMGPVWVWLLTAGVGLFALGLLLALILWLAYIRA